MEWSYLNCVQVTILFNFINVGISKKMEGFIVGGQTASILDFPHSAFLAVRCVKDTGPENYSCGSSILNQVTLLTAAHCFEDCLSDSTIGVAVAVENKRSKLSHLISYFTVHPEYHGVKVLNDIALARLSENLEFSDRVQRVAIMVNPPYNEVAEVAGWGLVDEEKKMGTIYLKYAKQRIWKRKKCIEALKKLNKGTICARGFTKTSNYGYPAPGDSGSALVVRRYIQVGLVSVKYPSISHSIIVFTHVPHYYKWIMRTAKKLYCMRD